MRKRKGHVIMGIITKTSKYIVTKESEGEFEVRDYNDNIVFYLKSSDFLGCIEMDDVLYYYMEDNEQYYKKYKIEDNESIFCTYKRW